MYKSNNLLNYYQESVIIMVPGRIIFLSCFLIACLCLSASSTHQLVGAETSPYISKLKGSLRLSMVITTDGLNHSHHDHNRDYCIAQSADGILSVDQFGAKGDGSDDTKAFMKAWGHACSSEEKVTLAVPAGKTYRLKPIVFTGPCQSALKLEISGTLVASEDVADYEEESRRRWLVFDRVENFVVQGGGTLNGKGKMWWEKSCKRKKKNHVTNCMGAPTALTFVENKNLVVRNLTIKDAQQMHLTFEKCENVEASNLLVKAPAYSPNTDGIHVTATKNILIANCTVGTGDDCVSIVSGSKKVQVRDIICGPGHGISIGSLGRGNSEAHVSGVLVIGAKLSGTTNGLRIKTWQGGSGSAEHIIYQNVEMDNVKNPIIIDQNYCDQDDPCDIQDSAVEVQNVAYHNISGTSATDVAINFDCSESHPCKRIKLHNVKLRAAAAEAEGKEAGAATARCKNVDAKIVGVVSPGCHVDRTAIN